MSQKFDFRAFLVMAITQIKRLLSQLRITWITLQEVKREITKRAVARIRYWLTLAKLSGMNTWSQKFEGPVATGFAFGLASGYTGLLVAPLIHDTLASLPVVVLLVLLVAIAASIAVVTYVFSTYVLRYNLKATFVFITTSISTILIFNGVGITAIKALAILSKVFIALLTLLVLRWLWNTLPELYREVTKTAVIGYAKALPGFVRQDQMLRRQTKQYLNYIGLFAAILLLFYDPGDPNYGQFTTRVLVFSMVVGAGFFLNWTIRWYRESGRRWSDARRQGAAAEHPEGAIAINLGYPMSITSLIYGVWLATWGVNTITLFSWKLAV